MLTTQQISLINITSKDIIRRCNLMNFIEYQLSHYDYVIYPIELAQYICLILPQRDIYDIIKLDQILSFMSSNKASNKALDASNASKTLETFKIYHDIIEYFIISSDTEVHVKLIKLLKLNHRDNELFFNDVLVDIIHRYATYSPKLYVINQLKSIISTIYMPILKHVHTSMVLCKKDIKLLILYIECFIEYPKYYDIIRSSLLTLVPIHLTLDKLFMVIYVRHPEKICSILGAKLYPSFDYTYAFNGYNMTYFGKILGDICLIKNAINNEMQDQFDPNLLVLLNSDRLNKFYNISHIEFNKMCKNYMHIHNISPNKYINIAEFLHEKRLYFIHGQKTLNTNEEYSLLYSPIMSENISGINNNSKNYFTQHQFDYIKRHEHELPYSKTKHIYTYKDTGRYGLYFTCMYTSLYDMMHKYHDVGIDILSHTDIGMSQYIKHRSMHTYNYIYDAEQLLLHIINDLSSRKLKVDKLIYATNSWEYGNICNNIIKTRKDYIKYNLESHGNPNDFNNNYRKDLFTILMNGYDVHTFMDNVKMMSETIAGHELVIAWPFINTIGLIGVDKLLIHDNYESNT
jgi:hypothetical protein